MMFIDYTGNCPICGAMLQQIASSPLTVSCPTGHYKMCFTSAAGMAGTSTIPLRKSDAEVPKAFQDAFADKKVLDP
jgi:hypothetical protein